jgi:hypothetical protein
MLSNSVTIGSLLLAACLASSASTAYADNLNTSGTICHSLNSSEAQAITTSTFGVRNTTPGTTSTSIRSIVCSVPRAPLASFGPFVVPSYFIDGRNNPGTCTQCTLSMYSFNGVTMATGTVTGCGTNAPVDWDLAVPMPAIAAGSDIYAYASVTCKLPGNSDGVLYGITAIQP